MGQFNLEPSWLVAEGTKVSLRLPRPEEGRLLAVDTS